MYGPPIKRIWQVNTERWSEKHGQTLRRSGWCWEIRDQTGYVWAAGGETGDGHTKAAVEAAAAYDRIAADLDDLDRLP